eukprot:1188147-Prorocentrum_minimum.AAC.1
MTLKDQSRRLCSHHSHLASARQRRFLHGRHMSVSSPTPPGPPPDASEGSAAVVNRRVTDQQLAHLTTSLMEDCTHQMGIYRRSQWMLAFTCAMRVSSDSCSTCPSGGCNPP